MGDCGCQDCAEKAKARLAARRLAVAAAEPAPVAEKPAAPVLMKPVDLRTCKFCNKGARKFFLAHNLNWQSFLKQGIDVRELEAIGDPQAMRAVNAARIRESRGQ